MSTKYLMKVHPLEPYSFLNDQSFEYPGENHIGKRSYFATSNILPEQTTILGMLRYVLLAEEKELFRPDFHYTPEDQVEIAKIIGANSFDFLAGGVQDFGKIEALSPMFLIKGEEMLVANPFSNKVTNGYEPIQMEKDIVSSYGTICIPKPGEYDAKVGYNRGFYNLNRQIVVKVNDIFKKDSVAGNKKTGDREKSFFRREIIRMDEAYSFGYYITVEDDTKVPESRIAYMGNKKSAFMVSFEKTTASDIEVVVRKHFEKQSEKWFYALSDIYVNEKINLQQFAIIEKRAMRNLRTEYSNGRGRLRKPTNRVNVITKGSVFYMENPMEALSDNATKIGYNKIVQIGGID